MSYISYRSLPIIYFSIKKMRTESRTWSETINCTFFSLSEPPRLLEAALHLGCTLRYRSSIRPSSIICIYIVCLYVCSFLCCSHPVQLFGFGSRSSGKCPESFFTTDTLFPREEKRKKASLWKGGRRLCCCLRLRRALPSSHPHNAPETAADPLGRASAMTCEWADCRHRWWI